MSPTGKPQPTDSTEPATPPTSASDPPSTSSSTPAGRAPLFSGDPTSSSPPPPPSQNDGPDFETEPPAPANGPDGGPTPATSPVALHDRKNLRRIIRTALELLTTAAATSLTDEVEKANGLYVATDTELTDASDHLGNVAAGRGLAATSEVAELVQAGVVIAAYAVRHIKLKADLRRLRRAQPAAAPPAVEDPQQAAA